MPNSSIENLKGFISKICNEKMNIELPEEIENGKPIVESFGLDSIDIYELILNLEKQYEVKIQDEQIATIANYSLIELDDFFNSTVEA